MLRDISNKSEVLGKLSKYGALSIRGGQNISSSNKQLVVAEHLDPEGPGRVLFCWYLFGDIIALLCPFGGSLCAQVSYLLPHQVGEKIEFICGNDTVSLRGNDGLIALKPV